MAGSWQGLADQINTIFNDPNLLHTFNEQFTDLHGVDGKGFRFGLLAS
jgi:hypothetical protein